MTAAGRRRLVWSGWAVSVASLVGAYGLTALSGAAAGWIDVFAVVMVVWSSVGSALCVRVPGNPIGWLFLGIGVISGVGQVCDAYAAPALRLPLASVAAVSAGLLQPLPLVVLPALLVVFPEGRLPSQRWRSAAVLWGVVTATYVLAALVWPGPLGLTSDPSLRNPIGIGGRVGGAIAIAGFASLAVSFVIVLVAAVSLILRFRRATGDLRQQLKWFGVAAIGVVLVPPMTLLLGTLPPPWSTVVSDSLWPVAACGLVAATGVAILHYRLYEIDVIIRKTLVYTALVGSLALVYLSGIYLIDRGLQAITGQSGAFAVTLSTLAVAAAFQPLRTRIQRTVDHRFYRGKYDAADTIEAFTTRLRDQIELDALSADLLGVVTATLQPSQASLWLRPNAGAPSSHTAYPGELR